MEKMPTHFYVLDVYVLTKETKVIQNSKMFHTHEGAKIFYDNWYANIQQHIDKIRHYTLSISKRERWG